MPGVPAARADAQTKTLRADERDRADVRAERAAFAARRSGLDPARLVFVDEAGVATDLTRSHGRAPKGQRAHRSAPRGRWRRLTVLGALGADGVAAAMSVERATDTAVFLAFLARVLIPELVRTRLGAVVVMDHRSPHKAPAVRQRLEAAGLELLDLPRSSPDLSPIEPLWSKLKALVRAAAARTVDALEAALAAALARVTAADARGRFQHCGYAPPAN